MSNICIDSITNPNFRYCNRSEDDLAAVTHFSYQEPENDPRNYVYIWVSQGPWLKENIEGMTSSIKMYQACYQSRNWINGIGTVFSVSSCNHIISQNKRLFGLLRLILVFSCITICACLSLLVLVCFPIL